MSHSSSSSAVCMTSGGAKPTKSLPQRAMSPRSRASASNRLPGGVAASGQAVGSEVKALQEAGTTHVPDERMGLRQPLEACAEMDAQLGSVRDQIALLVLGERRQPGRAGHRIAGEGVAVVELAPGVRIAEERLPNPVGNEHAGEGHVATAHPLTAGQQVGRHAVVVGAKPGAQADRTR